MYRAALEGHTEIDGEPGVNWGQTLPSLKKSLGKKCCNVDLVAKGSDKDSVARCKTRAGCSSKGLLILSDNVFRHLGKLTSATLFPHSGCLHQIHSDLFCPSSQTKVTRGRVKRGVKEEDKVWEEIEMPHMYFSHYINCISHTISIIFLSLYQLYFSHYINYVSLTISIIFLSLYQLYFSHCIKCISLTI